MRKPEEIKRGLECCMDTRCEGCPYFDIHHCAVENGLDALALVRQLEAQVPRWISVEERLPEDGQAVIVVLADRWCMMGWRWQGKWYTKPTIVETGVTHWMPLPEAPKEDDR